MPPSVAKMEKTVVALLDFDSLQLELCEEAGSLITCREESTR